MFGLGHWELLIILLIILMVFGAGKLPGVMRELGNGVKSFKDTLNAKEDDKNAPLLTEAPKKAQKPAKKAAAKKAPAKAKAAASKKPATKTADKAAKKPVKKTTAKKKA